VICVSGASEAAGAGFWATAIAAVIPKMAIPMPPAMRWIVAVLGCSSNSLENQPTFFI
jgi:hypothetical protein